MPPAKKQEAIDDLLKQRQDLHQQNDRKIHSKRMQRCGIKGCEKMQRSYRCDYHTQQNLITAQIKRRKLIGEDDIKEQQDKLRQCHRDDAITEGPTWRLLKSEANYKKALFAAFGHRPGHEYGVERAASSDRPYGATYLKCREQDCKFQRKIQRRKMPLSSSDHQSEYWDVYDNGPHNDDHGHLPAQRLSYPWSPEQEEILKNQFAMGRSFTATYLLRCLEIAGCVNYCTIDDIKRYCHANRTRLSRWEQKDALKVKDLDDILINLSQNDEDDDPSRLKPIPLVGDTPHILLGNPNELNKWKKLTGQVKPKLLEDGSPYAFTIPLASEDSLELLKLAHKQVHWELRSIGKDGPVLDEKTGIALGMVDGVWKLVKSGLAGVVRVGVTTVDNQFVDVAIIIVSGESQWSIYHGLKAIQQMAHEIVGKSFTKFIADSAPGIKAALRALKHGYMFHDDTDTDDDDFESQSRENEQDEYDFARCSVHTSKNDLDKMREKNPMKKGHFAQFKNRFRQLLKFPPKFFKAAWQAVADRYRGKGNKRYIKAVQENVINPKKSGAVMMGWCALGLSSSINSLERSNLWFQTEIVEELIRMEPQATMPTSLNVVVEILQRLWPIWTARSSKKMKRGGVIPSSRNKKHHQEKNF
jgi:hypothetical protein